MKKGTQLFSGLCQLNMVGKRPGKELRPLFQTQENLLWEIKKTGSDVVVF
jgi:hypothetical protein